MAAEKQAGLGRREAAYFQGMWPTEDDAMRCFAGGQADNRTFVHDH